MAQLKNAALSLTRKISQFAMADDGRGCFQGILAESILWRTKCIRDLRKIIRHCVNR